MTLCCVWWIESYMVSRPTRKAMFCSVSVNPGVLNDQARVGQRVCPCGSLLCYLLLLCIEDIVSLHSSGAFDGRASRCSDSHSRNMWVRQVWREYLRLAGAREQVGRCCAKDDPHLISLVCREQLQSFAGGYADMPPLYLWILTFNIVHFHVWRLAKCERLSLILYARPNELQSAGIGKSFACPVGTVHPWLSRCQTALPRNWEAPLVHDNLGTWGLGNCPIESLPPKHLNIKYPPLRASKMSTIPNQWDSCRILSGYVGIMIP